MTSLIVQHPCGYWAIAVGASLLYAFRGWVYQNHAPYQPLTENAKYWEKVIINNGHDALYNFACSMAGFSALRVVARILLSITNFSTIEAGTAAALAFLTLLAILGISGVLPRMIWRGNISGIQK